jgi:hypothetical protein
MKFIKHIAVLATAALMIATSFAADSFSPASLGAHTAVAVDPTTHVQVSPPSFYQLIGFNGDITNAASPSLTGTNFVITPIAPYQWITLSTNINLAHATNKVAGTGWDTKLFIKANAVDRTLTVPSTWNWLTNANQSIVSGTPTNTFIIGKLTTIPSNSIARLDITAIGTNVLIKADVYRP